MEFFAAGWFPADNFLSRSDSILLREPGRPAGI